MARGPVFGRERHAPKARGGLKKLHGDLSRTSSVGVDGANFAGKLLASSYITDVQGLFYLNGLSQDDQGAVGVHDES